MNIVIAGGGTGGHLFPALAIAGELKKRFDDVKITFVGTAKGIEARIVPKEGYDLRFIRSEGLVGKNIYRTAWSFLKVPLSLKDSYMILKDLNPDLVFGVGGYSSGLVQKLYTVPEGFQIYKGLSKQYQKLYLFFDQATQY